MTRRVDNNLDVLRLFAAQLVLVGHSFFFLGLHEPKFMSVNPLGPIGVYIFFIISGFLVSESWDRDPHLGRYFARRLLRIMPGLVVCTIFCVFVLGPLLTTLPLRKYFAHAATYAYFSNVALYITYYLPGMFETNRLANAVNGSLWSLPVEFVMYIVVAALGVVRSNRWVFLAVAVLSALACYFWAWTAPMTVVYRFDARQIFICGTFFWVGAVFYKFGAKRHLSTTAVVLAFTASICLEPYPALVNTTAWILLPVIALSFGFAYSPLLTRLTATGDYSYGIYIYAFPIQQSVVYLLPGISIGPFLAVCTGLTLVAAILSWHLVEKRALAFKPGRSTRREGTVASGAARLENVPAA